MNRPSPGARAAVATIVTSVAVAALASRPDSPVTPLLYPGDRAPGPLAWVARVLGLEALPRDVAGLVGAILIVGAVVAFLYALRRAWRGQVSVRMAIAVAVGLHLLAFLIPLFLSRDVYSYAMYGRIVSVHGANPYVRVPAYFRTDPFYLVISSFWIDSPSVYGPGFTALSAGLTGLVHGPIATIRAFKALAAMSGIGTVLLAVASARKIRPQRAAFVAVLIGWNPVVVFHAVGGGHNDALVGLAIAAAVLLVLSGRWLWATAALAAGVMVKVSAGVPLLIAVAAAVAARPPGRRLRSLAAHVGVVLAVAAPFVIPFEQSRDPTLGTLELATRQGWLAPSRFLIVTFRSVGRFLAGKEAGDLIALIPRAAFPAALVLVLYGLVRHLARDPARIDGALTVGAMGWAILIAVMTSPLLLPWYVVWVLPLSWPLPGKARWGGVFLSVALAVTELVAEPSDAPRLWELMVLWLHYVATPIVLVVLVRLLIDLRRRLRLTPAGGFDDPLLREEVGSAGPSGGDVAEDRQRPHRRLARARGRETDEVRADRAEDRHRESR